MKYFSKLILISLSFILLFNTIQGQDAEATAAGVYNDGLALLKAKDFAAGLEKMLEAISLADPEADAKVIELAQKNGSIAASNLGNASYKAKDFESALQQYTQGYELNQESTSNALGLARAHNKLGNAVEAVKGYMMAGNLYKTAGKADRAGKTFGQAATVVGKLYVDKDYDGALEAGNTYLAIQDDAEVRYYMSRSLIEKNENEMALEHISKALELASSDGGETKDKYYMAHGMSLENLGRSGEAIEAYGKITGAKYKAQAEYRISQLKA